MFVKQISVFLENKSGRLAVATRVLAENNIDIRALSIAETTDYGILRLIVNKPDEAIIHLKAADFAVSATTVIAIAIEDKPGGLTITLEALEKEDISVEYMYAFASNSGKEALVIMKVNEKDKALEVLLKNKVKVMPLDEVYHI
jgi:hypothetical protein